MSKYESQDSLKSKKLVVVFTHTNYTLISGGTEKFLREYVAILRKNDIVDITIFPITHRGKSSLYYVGIFFNEKFLGIYNSDKIEDVIVWHINKYKLLLDCITIQHLKNINLDVVFRVIDFFKVHVILFIHDYYSICCNSRLISNSGKQCGFEAPNNTKCRFCKMRELGMTHFAEISYFYKKIDRYLLKIYVPSEFVKEKILSVYPQWIDRLEKRPHLKMSGHKKYVCCKGKVKLAYVGAQINDKGYDKWIELVSELLKYCPDAYEFYYFGYGENKVPGVKNIYVAESSGQKMEEILEKYNINLAFFWTKCSETYSYVYYEMSLAGVYIMTNQISGNVAFEVNKNKNGKAFVCFKEAIEWAKNPELVKKEINNYRLYGKYTPAHKQVNDEIEIPRVSLTHEFGKGKNNRNIVLTTLYYAKHIIFNKGEHKIL